MRRPFIPYFVGLVLLVVGSIPSTALAQRTSQSELWREVIGLRVAFQREKVEVLKARERLRLLRQQRQSSQRNGKSK